MSATAAAAPSPDDNDGQPPERPDPHTRERVARERLAHSFAALRPVLGGACCCGRGLVVGCPACGRGLVVGCPACGRRWPS